MWLQRNTEFKRQLVIRKAKAARVLGDHLDQPPCFSYGETEAQSRVRTCPRSHRETDGDKLKLMEIVTIKKMHLLSTCYVLSVPLGLFHLTLTTALGMKQV